MTTKTGTNGQVRRTLADQIDRLDSMLDGLADGLNDAVAQAVKEAVGAAVQQAVQAVLREALANPELAARLAGLAAPASAAAAPAPPAEPVAPAAKATWAQRWLWVTRKLTAHLGAVGIECGRRLGQARRCVAAVWSGVCLLGRFPYSLLTAAAVAMAAGVAGCFTHHGWTAAYAAVYGFVVLTVARVRAAWKRLTAPAATTIA